MRMNLNDLILFCCFYQTLSPNKAALKEPGGYLFEVDTVLYPLSSVMPQALNMRTIHVFPWLMQIQPGYCTFYLKAESYF